MAYFTLQEFQLQLSPAISNRIFGDGSELGFGEIGATSGSLRFTQLAEQASGYVDAFLEPAGYQVPLNNPTPFIKRAAIYRCIADIYGLADLPVNEHLMETVSRNESLLHDLAIGKIPIPGKTQDLDTGTGGHSFSAASGSAGPVFGKTQLGGTFF